MSGLTFKRAKRVIALHYGSHSFSTRKLCQLFNVNGLTKDAAILQEAKRIIALRQSLGFQITDSGIDATWDIEVDRQKQANTGRWPRSVTTCLTCKMPLQYNGWTVDNNSFPACLGDCTLIAKFYYLKQGVKNTPCTGFKVKYGCAVEDLSPTVSFDAMLAYMVHLSASRTQSQNNEAKLRNPTFQSV